jgi:EmrB/QacA subfamily drug resistance transporter
LLGGSGRLVTGPLPTVDVDSALPRGGNAAGWWTLAAGCIAAFALLINVTIIIVALPSIGAALGTDFTGLRWVVNAYTVALATLLLGAGSLADRLGHRRTFTIGLLAFLAASVACAAAPSATFLIGSRVAQGGAAALLFSTSLALIASSFEGRERSTAFGVWAGTVGAATALGPLLGGMLVELGSWRWIFVMNIPAVLAALTIVSTKVRGAHPGTGAPIDWPGQLLAAAGVFLVVFGITEGGERGWSDPLVLTCLGAGPVILGAFAYLQSRVAHPMLDLRLLRQRYAIGAAAGGFALHCSLFAMLVFLTIFLQEALGYSALEAGLITLPTAAMSVAVGPLSGRIAGWAGQGLRIGAGLVTVGIGLALLTGVDSNSDWTAFVGGFLVAGFGVGIANPAIADAALASARAARSGTASAINVTFRQLGTSLGVAGLGTILQLRAEEHASTLIDGTPLAQEPHAVEAVNQVAVGNGPEALQSAPGGIRLEARELGLVAFSDALDEVLFVAMAVAMAGAVFAGVTLGRRGRIASPEAARR